MNGILIVNKEPNMTSRDVVNVLARKFHTNKIGHAGTLDPMATGVLVICLGNLTKLTEVLTGHEKIYEFEMELGKKTDTYDKTGILLEVNDVNISEEEIKESIANFPKVYMQEVPIYSAVKVNGRKLYEYARCNIDVELPKREVQIHSLELLKIDGNKLTLKAKVSKGTYIRSLVMDIAKSMHTVAIMTMLNRVKQGVFNVEDSYTLKDIEEDNYKFVDLNEALSIYPEIEVNEELAFKIKNGTLMPRENDDVVLYKHNGNIIALYKTYDKDNSYLKPWKML